MIELFTANTPNGKKISIMLEEIGYDYKVTKIDLDKGDQFKSDFKRISPFSKIPVIFDHESNKSIFESGAILIYLADKTNSALLPFNPYLRIKVMEWLMFQMANLGPMLGQAHHFLFEPRQVVPYAQKRYHEETERLYDVLNDRLGQSQHIALDTYSIADIAAYPWINRHLRHQIDLKDFPNVERWHKTLSARSAIIKGMAVP